MQSEVMKFDPATGEPRPYPSHAEQWRKWHGHSCAWLFNPWTGGRRDARDVGGDTNGRLIAPHGTLGSDLGVKTVPDNTANFVLGRLPCCVTSLLLHNIKHRPTA